MKNTLEVGSILIANNTCRMIITKEGTLTLGKSYEIISKTRYEIVIIDDQNDKHTFEIAELKKFFEV